MTPKGGEWGRGQDEAAGIWVKDDVMGGLMGWGVGGGKVGKPREGEEYRDWRELSVGGGIWGRKGWRCWRMVEDAGGS